MNEAPVISLSNNIKTVNTVYVSESENRLITGSVDCHVKIYDLNEVSSADQVQSCQPAEVPKANHWSGFYL